jgi:hypothetical protein
MAGRPTKYKGDYSQELEEYLSTCGREQTKLPKVGEFARFIGINDDTSNEWTKKYKEYSATIKKLKSIQRAQLMDDGLYGGKEANVAMAIFLLKSNHDMIETDRKILSGEDGAPLGVVVLPEIYEGSIKQPEDKLATSSGTSDSSTKEN